jgi:hypothetical protein
MSIERVELNIIKKLYNLYLSKTGKSRTTTTLGEFPAAQQSA